MKDLDPTDAPSASRDGFDLFADVAVPLPLAQPLTYSVPWSFAPLARVGCRARVRVGSRRCVGVIVQLRDSPPPEVRTRPLDEVLDRWPLLGADLLELARFVAEYYLAPLGEVVHVMLPGDLPSWGNRRIKLTSQGALARPRSTLEAQVIQALLEGGTMTVGALQAHLGFEELDEALEPLRETGRIVVDDPSRRGSLAARGEYVKAVELPAGDLAQQKAACGRSPAGRAVVEFLASLGRPATVQETTAAVDCGPGVVQRLIARGILRTFTQRAANRTRIEGHILAAQPQPPITLRDDQSQAVGRLQSALQAREYAPFLLVGMTGSGKTEVYLRAVREALELGRSAILLVPEIALVPALAGTVEERFGESLAILHSAMGRSERQRQWERVRRGDVRVVLGPRSAIFAPVSDLGLVVVDEEQDSSYKQETTPRYNGRDLALVRSQRARAVAVLVSATPSLETRYNVERHRYQRLQLTSRVGYGELPEGILVDLRQEEVARRPGEIHFSSRLRDELTRTLEAGEQAILLRNRRGYAPVLLCRACGEDMRCDLCGLPRTYHRKDRRLLCHYCGSTRPVPRSCPVCSQEALEPTGAGTERVEERFRALFPGVGVDVLDRDSVRREGGATTLLEKFATGETQVLIGTQMVSKGHHFPQVSLTAVLSADTYLGYPDFRAAERTYSLLTQLAGRAGRGAKPGRVVIQTYYPEHYVIQAALGHDDDAFLKQEMRFRRIFHYPPYSRMLQLLVRDKSQERGRRRIADLARLLESHPLAAGVRILGPAPAPLEKLRGYWRFQLLLRSSSGERLRRLVQKLPPSSASELTVDMDPYDLL